MATAHAPHHSPSKANATLVLGPGSEERVRGDEGLNEIIGHGWLDSVSELTKMPQNHGASSKKLTFQMAVWGGNPLFGCLAKSAKRVNVRRVCRAAFRI